MDIHAAESLANQLLQQHKLRGWRFQFDHARWRFGCCFHRQHLITLSRRLTELNPESEVRDTILHEIAHALAGPSHGHDNAWKLQARQIGARPQRCYSSDTTTTLTFEWNACCKWCGTMRTEKGLNKPREYVCNPCWDAAVAITGVVNPPNINAYIMRWRKIREVIFPAKVLVAPPQTIVIPTELPAMPFSATEAVRLYQAGTKVVDIAVAMGYERGHGQNRVRAALIKAGVYRQAPVDFRGGE